MLKSQLESILFISNKPLSLKELSDICGRSKEEVETTLLSLKEDYNQPDKGIKLLDLNDKFQFVTSPGSREVVENFLKAELTGELTRPQLETLTIICYRSPISKLELEQIRGVNCTIILRNLMMRGLVEQVTGQRFQVSFEFMKHLGLNNLSELPDYDNLSKHETLEELLNIDSQNQ